LRNEAETKRQGEPAAWQPSSNCHLPGGLMARILVIDDEPKIVSFVSRALCAKGHGVDGAYDGPHGLKLALSGRYDLIVLDLLLPRLDGHSLLRQTMKANPGQKVLVLSALGDVTSKVGCLESGACDYLTKPFELAELVARIRRHLRPAAVEVGEQLRPAASVTLDLERRSATVGDRSVPLSTREFAIMQHLVRRPGRICSRQELLADVWGYSFDPGSNVVDVYVRRLRAKVGPDVIETVRHAGYRLQAP
jgi:DNA-binding response OmpR family regulator